MNTRNVRQLKVLIFTLIAIVTLGIGYAGITAINLVINGDATASVNDQNFKVRFLSEENVTPTITGEGNTVSVKDDTTAEFSVSTLTGLGDSEVATFRVKNESKGIGADISLSVTSSNSEYFKVTEYVADTQLQAGDETTVTVTVEMIKTPITDSVSTSITATLTASPLENETATGGSPASAEPIPDPVSFSTDSWATIQKAVQNNNTSAYNVGDTKSVTINGNNYMVRIANKTIGEHCGDNDTEYSQTACGFVVEFADIITEMKMRDTNTNVSGYPATLVYDYLKNTLYSQLPSDLQTVIKPTRVISGYGSNDSTNFTTTDKLYLLSSEEVYGIDDGQYHFYDTAYGTSHQLEYYSNNGVTYSTSSWNGTNLDKAIKQYNSSNTWWWLRPAYSDISYGFAGVSSDGSWDSYGAGYASGVAPAFRIG